MHQKIAYPKLNFLSPQEMYDLSNAKIHELASYEHTFLFDIMRHHSNYSRLTTENIKKFSTQQVPDSITRYRIMFEGHVIGWADKEYDKESGHYKLTYDPIL